jgi:cyclomaltodextrinase
VYAGDEYGMRAVKEARIGGDDAVRPAFPPVPPAAAGLDPEAREVLHTHQALVALRRRHPWLHRAHTDVVHLANTAIVLRTATGTDAVVTALNLGDEPVSLPAAGATRVEAGDGVVAAGAVQLPPHGWAVLAA